MTEKYDNLRYFCSYFGPSWKTDFGNVDRAIQFIFRLSDASILRSLKAEIDVLLKNFPNDTMLEEALLAFGCFYSPSHANLTDREWLRSVQEQIEEHLKATSPKPTAAIPQNPLNGIPGKTSDDRLRRPKVSSPPKPPWHMPRWAKRTIGWTAFLLPFIVILWPGISRIGKQAIGGVVHQLPGQTYGQQPVPSTSVAANKPSFDCTRAKTSTERMICANGDLALKEREMATTYHSRLKQLTPADAIVFRHEHLEWFHEYQKRCNPLNGIDLRNCIATSLSDHAQKLVTWLPAGSQRTN